MSEVQLSPNVFGVETEYSCLLVLPGNKIFESAGICHATNARMRLYAEPKGKGTDALTTEQINEALGSMGIVRTEAGMLSNGGRFYIDPSGPEYDTPETSTAAEATLRSFDGDRILAGVFNYIAEQGGIESFQINRRIVDHNRTSRGIHLNTATTLPSKPSPNTVEQLATLNVVKGAIFGSGGLLLDEYGSTSYHHSPRLSLTTDIVADYTDYKLRPLVRYPFKEDGHSLRRIETVTSDALNFAWPLRASLVLTNAVTKVIELGYGPELPVLKEPIKAAHAVGRHGNNSHVGIMNLDRDRQYRPSDVIQYICGVIFRADHQEGFLDKESDQVIGEIVDVADQISRDMFSVADRVESVYRLMAMERKMSRDNLAFWSEKMCRFDYAWDWYGGGIAEILRDDKKVGWHGFGQLPSIRAARKRIVTPPQDTRAKLRGESIQRLGPTNLSSWDNIDLGTHKNYVPPIAS